MEYRATIIEGHQQFVPVEYRVAMKVEGPWWWRQRRWYVETDYGTFGSFDTESEAVASAYRMSQV